MMKVLHFYKTYFPDTVGGIEQAINQISRATAKLGIEAHVLSLSKAKKNYSLQFEDHVAHKSPLTCTIASNALSIKVCSQFHQLAKKADLIHYHFPWPFMDMLHFLTPVNKPTLVTYHSDIIRQRHLLKLYRPLQKRFLGSVDHIVATSPHYLASSNVLSSIAHKVSIIPIGLNKTLYPAATPEKLAYWQERLGSKFFLFIGVLRYYKGLHILMEAAKGLDYPIVIVGAGPIEQALKAQVIKLNLTNIHFLGYINDDDKIALLTLCYSILFPSHLRSEAFGISLLEGCMFGKPMISSEIGTGTTFINVNHLTGLVVPAGDPDAFRIAMQYLWNNPDKAKAMGQCAETRYWAEFTAEQMALQYVRLYERLLV